MLGRKSTQKYTDMKYVSAQDIEKYVLQLGELETSERLATMVNWFADGAVTTLSNHIMDAFDKSPTSARLEYNIAEGCRCMGCYEFQIVDENQNVIDSIQDLKDWVIR